MCSEATEANTYTANTHTFYTHWIIEMLQKYRVFETTRCELKIQFHLSIHLILFCCFNSWVSQNFFLFLSRMMMPSVDEIFETRCRLNAKAIAIYQKAYKLTWYNSVSCVCGWAAMCSPNQIMGRQKKGEEIVANVHSLQWKWKISAKQNKSDVESDMKTTTGSIKTHGIRTRSTPNTPLWQNVN